MGEGLLAALPGCKGTSAGWCQDPRDSSWHELAWEHAAALGRPFSREAAAYARRLAVAIHRFPDTKQALAELLDRWGAGLDRQPH